MIIKLVGKLDFELIRLGLEEGDTISPANFSDDQSNSVTFTRYHNGFKYDCVVSPENYQIIEDSPSKQINNGG